MFDIPKFYLEGLKIESFNIGDYDNDTDDYNRAINDFLSGDEDFYIDVHQITHLSSDGGLRTIIEYYIKKRRFKYEDLSDEEKEEWDKFYGD